MVVVPFSGFAHGSSGRRGAHVFWSEMHQRAMELAVDVYGPRAMLIDAGPE